MRILNFNSDINFQKILRANCKVIKNGLPSKCKIYQLENPQDKDYFDKLSEKECWDGAVFLDRQSENIKDINHEFNIFVMEDEKSECLGYITCADFAVKSVVDFLETAPKLKHEAASYSDESFRYIGETLLSFVAKRAKWKLKSKIELDSTEGSKNFYTKKCGFKHMPANDYYESPYGSLYCMVLPYAKFDSLIKQNEEHTQGTINFIA